MAGHYVVAGTLGKTWRQRPGADLWSRTRRLGVHSSRTIPPHHSVNFTSSNAYVAEHAVILAREFRRGATGTQLRVDVEHVRVDRAAVPLVGKVVMAASGI